MSSILYSIIVSPIELVVEFVFELLFRLLGHGEKNQGLAVIGVSLAISLLTLPLYRRADFVQQKERDLQNKMKSGIKRIKETFKGDERFMMLQTFYRENNYSPLYALKGSLSLLLEIPFFIAAYHFLSHLEVLQNAAFGFISNLGQPDSLINTGFLTINILPILMTAINCISSAIYLKGFPLKSKMQVYGMALIFLVVLYNSPSGLVIYWTCNNIFSLIKNIFYKIRNPRKILGFLCAFIGTACTIIVFSSGILNSTKKMLVVLFFFFGSFVPLLSHYIKRPTFFRKLNKQSSTSMFLLPALFLVIITGLLIPVAAIVSSPADFIDINDYHNPIHFLLKSFCYAIGFFLFWSFIIYRMLTNQGKHIFSFLLAFFSFSGVTNYMMFSNGLGTVSSLLVFDAEPVFPFYMLLLNVLVNSMIFIVLILIYKRISILNFTYSILVFGVSSLSIFNIFQTQVKLSKMSHIKSNAQEATEISPVFTLSKSGKNVIVIMLDGAVSSFFPLCLEEKPVLKDQFSGFDFYPNMISFGTKTLFGATAIFGGYDYTIPALEKRTSLSMREKHNEALKVMPKIFSSNAFEVTVCDVPYANYQLIPDLTIYDDIPKIQPHILKGKYTNLYLKNRNLKDFEKEKSKRAFFCYSIFNIAPIILKNIIYDDGNYYNSNKGVVTRKFLDSYSELDLMPELTNFTDSTVNTFIMMDLESTHEPCYLYTPNYDIEKSKNNEKTKLTSHSFKTSEQIKKYNINMASYLKLGEYFDYLRENNVFDNTRIIIVADHGHRNTKNGSKTVVGLKYFDYMTLKLPEFEFDVDSFNPLLLVKDFNSNELKTSDEFMTTADVPTLATQGLLENPINPFTGNKITSEEKGKMPQTLTCSLHYELPDHDVPTLDLSDGYLLTVHDNIFKVENWRIKEN